MVGQHPKWYREQKYNKWRKRKMEKIAAWVATAIAVSVGLIVTKSPLCLGAFIVPLLASMVI